MLLIEVNFHFEYDQSVSILLTQHIGVRVLAMECTTWRGEEEKN